MILTPHIFHPASGACTFQECIFNKETFSIHPLKASESAEIISNISSIFSSNKAMTLPGTKYLKFFELDGRNYFGMHKDDQAKADFSFIRSTILQKLNFSTDTPIIQIIGDSAKFSIQGTAFAKKYLAEQLTEYNNALYLWGYTANGDSDSNVADINGIFNEWIDYDPSHGKMVLGNIVDFGQKTIFDPENIADTQTVIKDYGAKVAEYTNNFYVVYGKAQFGDDINSSDKLTSLSFCFDGGPQSWRQIVNFLSQNIQVSGIFNLRDVKNIPFFSAGEFIYLLSNAIEERKANNKQINEKFINDFKDNYLKTHYLFNPERHDSHTKQALFDIAWKTFIDEKLWKRLRNCNFHKFENIIMSRL